MKVGITGFPGSGKSTIFRSLAAGATPSAGRGPVMGNIKVPDARVDFLSALFNPKRTVYAQIDFVDVPGGGDPRAGVFAPDVVAAMRQVDVLVHVARCFANPYTGDAPDPARDEETFRSELLLQDMTVVEKRLERLHKERRKDSEVTLLERLSGLLEDEIPLRHAEFDADEKRILRSYALLSLKPKITLYNLDEAGWSDPAMAAFRTPAAGDDANELAMGLCGLVEADVAEMDPEEQVEFLAEYGLTAPARDQFIQAAYRLLDLISFLTEGGDECRAWPIRRGTLAPHAGGKVHSDIERGFIRAEIIAWEDFEQLKSEAAARKAGKLRVEGKNYEMKDGDVVHFLFNV